MMHGHVHRKLPIKVIQYRRGLSATVLPNLRGREARGKQARSTRYGPAHAFFGQAEHRDTLLRENRTTERPRYPCPSRKSYPSVAMLQSAQDWRGNDGPDRCTARRKGESLLKPRCVRASL